MTRTLVKPPVTHKAQDAKNRKKNGRRKCFSSQNIRKCSPYIAQNIFRNLKATFPAFENLGAELEGFFAYEGGSCHRGFTIVLKTTTATATGGSSSSTTTKKNICLVPTEKTQAYVHPHDLESGVS